MTPDGRGVVRAITTDWIVRGFLFGLGFWFAGLAFSILAAVALYTLGAAFALPGRDPPSPVAASVAPPGPAAPADKRPWQEQLRAGDAARQEMQRREARATR